MTSPPSGPTDSTEETTGETVLRISAAHKSYAHTPALRGVDLQVAPGEVYALLGPNGSGKTTLLRSIYGRVGLDRGEIDVCGRDPRRDRPARAQLGLVPQSVALYPYLSAAENLHVFARLSGVDSARARAAVARALEWTGLAPRADDRAEQLSGGMQRRLNIAAATLHGPRLLLLDEPTVGIDPDAREAIHELLRELAQDGTGMLLTTHDMEEAEALCHRVGFLVDGRVRAEGTVASLVGEAFGDDRELIVTVAEAPNESARAALAAEGLQETRIAQTWTARLPREQTDLSAIERHLESLGLGVSELRVREPGLRSIYLRLTGQEYEG